LWARKTSSLVYAIMYAIKHLLGKKDKEGHNPKIMVCSKNLTFLAKTWTNAFEQNLQMTNSEYKYDKAKNIMCVGNVEIILVPTEEPSNIYGYSTCLALVDELDELDTQTAMEAVKSINDRVRQQIEGFRSPFVAFATTSQGLKGMYQTVMHFNKSGIGYILMRARTRDNIFLPKDYVKNLYSIYNEKERKCLLEGVFISIDSGLIFPDYHPDVNKLDSDLYDYARDNSLPIYIGQDFNGFGNNAHQQTDQGDGKGDHQKLAEQEQPAQGFLMFGQSQCHFSINFNLYSSFMASMGVMVSTLISSRASRMFWAVMSSMDTWSCSSVTAGLAAGFAPSPLSSSRRISRARVMTVFGRPASLATSTP
jgi:hypothetical protein